MTSPDEGAQNDAAAGGSGWALPDPSQGHAPGNPYAAPQTPPGAAPQVPPQGQFPQAQYPQTQYPQGQYPQGQYPQGQYPQGPYSQAQPQYPGMPMQQSQQRQWGQPPTPPGPPANGNRKRSRTIAAIAVPVVIALVVALVVLLPGHKTPTPTAATTVTAGQASTAASPGSDTTSAPAAGSSGVFGGTALAADAPPCPKPADVAAETAGYIACGQAARNVGLPVYNAAQAQKTYTVTIHTTQGPIVFTAEGVKAPYTVYSFLYLAQKAYFNDSPCHRLTTSGIFVLQCGDPTGTGTGTPGYQFQDENLNAYGLPGADSTVTYPPGSVAMANSGPGTNGSQFFLVYRDSPLPPSYTPFGQITQGLDILQKIAAAGTDDANGTGDGNPNTAVQIQSVTVG
ncbi:MAG TPA: peptidylprolyl isomerase [Actinocrinis sp.]|nr:peptidylprolyl isomerase [Actinocrinis sp.]